MGWAIAAVVAVVGAAVSNDQQQKANYQQRLAGEEGKRIQREQQAQNAAQQAAERRKQIREERVRRARIIQASSNSGTEASSGELGAIGGLSTNLNSNIGQNLGAVQSANNISIFSQNISDLQGNALKYQSNAALASNLGQIGSSLAMGFGNGGKK